MPEVKHISVTINRAWGDVYEYVSNPENLPQWAAGLASAVEKIGEDWTADSTMGKIKIRFAEKNKFGILDHNVILESGDVFYNPMRVLPNGNGSEVVFTLFRTVDMSVERFVEDAEQVANDLMQLKTILER